MFRMKFKHILLSHILAAALYKTQTHPLNELLILIFLNTDLMTGKTVGIGLILCNSFQ